uniref:Uncharacterized protein n=1 Tax=Anopheles albimanus TaxID=7167 RepID=A0A182FY71_ANOAL
MDAPLRGLIVFRVSGIPAKCFTPRPRFTHTGTLRGHTARHNCRFRPPGNGFRTQDTTSRARLLPIEFEELLLLFFWFGLVL